jgi:hypothetical protein
VPDRVDDDLMALLVGIDDPPGTMLIELVQRLPVTALGDPIGNVGLNALRQASKIVTALIGT